MRRLLVVLILAAAVIGVVSAYRVTVAPFRVEARDLRHGTATTRMLVDGGRSFLPTTRRKTNLLIVRSRLVSLKAGTNAIATRIAQLAGVPANELSAAAGPARIEQARGGISREPTAAERAVQVARATMPYDVRIQVQTGLPFIDVATRAPDEHAAARLADATVIAVREELTRSAALVRRRPDIVVRQVGRPATAGAGPGHDVVVAAVVGLVAFLVLLFVGLTLRSAVRHSLAPADALSASRT